MCAWCCQYGGESDVIPDSQGSRMSYQWPGKGTNAGNLNFLSKSSICLGIQDTSVISNNHDCEKHTHIHTQNKIKIKSICIMCAHKHTCIISSNTPLPKMYAPEPCSIDRQTHTHAYTHTYKYAHTHTSTHTHRINNWCRDVVKKLYCNNKKWLLITSISSLHSPRVMYARYMVVLCEPYAPQLRTVVMGSRFKSWTMSSRRVDTSLPLSTMKSAINQYNTVQVYCVCVEKFAFWLITDIKWSIHFTIKYP